VRATNSAQKDPDASAPESSRTLYKLLLYLRSDAYSLVAQRILRADHAQRSAASARRAALESADPFDVEAQRKIEEDISKANVEANYESAMEQAPEMVVGQVFMLYVPCEANGVALKAFVDSGAQMTIMTAVRLIKTKPARFR